MDSEWMFLASEADRRLEDYDSITPAELEVFDLDRHLIGDLYEAYNRYFDYLGIVSPAMDEERAEADRREHPSYFPREVNGVPEFSNYLGARFMHDVCGLPYEQSYRYLVKIEMAQWRVGLIEAIRPEG